MNTRSFVIGSFSSILSILSTACASGAATSPPEARGPTALADAHSDVMPRRSCGPSNTTPAPADGLLADFSTKKGPVRTFVPSGFPTTTLSQSTEAGHLAMHVSAVPGAKPQILSANMLLDSCVDASGYSGVEFSLSGSLSGCSLVYASIDPEHQYYRPEGPYPPQLPISAADVTAQPRTFRAPFHDPGIPGNPATPTDASKLSFMQWLVIVPVGSIDGTPVPPCNGSLAIDDVKLYR